MTKKRLVCPRVAEQVDLSNPASRREALRSVSLNDPASRHGLLREIFDLERAWRESSDQGRSDEFENIYVAAFLLYLVGDPSDAPSLYGAKFRTGDMDLGTGFDAQAIFGAGRSETLQWLLDNGYPEEHAQLSEWLALREDPSIENWAAGKRQYFYSADGALLLDPL